MWWRNNCIHKCLGRKYTGDLTKCRRIGFQHRVNLVWAKFGHYRTLSQNMCKFTCGLAAICDPWTAPVSFPSRIEATRTRERTKLTNNCISIKLRLRLFDAFVTPTILCGLISMPLTTSDLNQLDAIQRRMLRSLVGWVCVHDVSYEWARAISFTFSGCHKHTNWKHRFANRYFH